MSVQESIIRALQECEFDEADRISIKAGSGDDGNFVVFINVFPFCTGWDFKVTVKGDEVSIFDNREAARKRASRLPF